MQDYGVPDIDGVPTGLIADDSGTDNWTDILGNNNKLFFGDTDTPVSPYINGFDNPEEDIQQQNYDAGWYDNLLNNELIKEEILPYMQSEEIESLAIAANYNQEGEEPNFAFVGGSAARLYILNGIMRKHGLPFDYARSLVRDTHDIDIVSFNETEMKNTLRKGEYKTRYSENKYIGNKQVGGSNIHIDAFDYENPIGSSGLKIGSDSTNYIDLGGISCPVAPLEDIIATKLRVKADYGMPRDKDLSDVANLIALYNGEIDSRYLMSRLADNDNKWYNRIDFLKESIMGGSSVSGELVYSPAETLQSIQMLEYDMYRTAKEDMTLSSAKDFAS